MRVKQLVSWMVCCICLLSACVTEDLQNPMAGDGEGYLSLRLSSISADVSSATATKGKLTKVPSENEFTIDLKKEGTSVSGFPKSYSSLPSSMVLPIGEYTIETYNTTTNNPIQESAYFYGNSTVKVLPNQPNSGSVEAKLANALLTPVVSDDLKKHYTNWTLRASSGTNSADLANQSETKTLYAKAGETITFTFEGTNLTGQTTTTSWQMPNPVVACTEYIIQCDPNISVFSQIQVTAKATHTYDASYLNGTDVILNCYLNGANAEAIQTWNVQVMYNGTAIRSYSGGSTPNDLTMTKTDGWPYIPQGSTLSASVTLKARDEIQLTNSSFSSLPLPTFGITVSGETSYSVYKQLGASEANQKDGSSIFNIGSTVKISEDILNNSNYAHMLPKVSYTTDTGQNSGELAYNTPVSDFSGLNWQKHVLSVTATFDGATVSNSQDCHVTGLPFISNPPTNTFWSEVEGNISWESDYVRIGYWSSQKSCEIKSHTLHIPSDVNASIHAKYNIRRGSRDNTFIIFVGSTAVIQDTNSSYNSTKSYDKEKDVVLSTSNNYIRCQNSYSLAEAWSDLYSVEIHYK